MDDNGETVEVFPDSSIEGWIMLLSRNTGFWKEVSDKIAELLKSSTITQSKV